MTGPEHYAAAEDLLDQLTHDDPSGLDYPVEQMIGMAQIHAQLALAAATALSGIEQGAAYGSEAGPVALSGHDATDWQRVAGYRR